MNRPPAGDPHWARRIQRRASRVWFLPDLWLGYAARIAGGSFAAAVLPVTLAYVSDTSVATSRARRFAWMSAASVIGFLAGASLGGWLAAVPGSGSVPATALPFLAVKPRRARLDFCRRCLSELATPVRAATRAPMPRTTRLLLVLSLFVTFGIGGFEVGLTLSAQASRSLADGPRAHRLRTDTKVDAVTRNASCPGKTRNSQACFKKATRPPNAGLGRFPALLRECNVQVLAVANFSQMREHT